MQNIKYTLENIKYKYEEPFLIAIDAALSNKKNIGEIVVSTNKMNIGKCIGGKNLYVGDISIKGIVSKNLKNYKNNFMLLQNTPLNLIMNMADLVSYRNI